MIAPKLIPILAASLLASALASTSAATAQQTTADQQDAELAYAQCMRDNGYAEFPDPIPDGGFRFLINPETAPRFHAAAAACEHLTPEGMRDEGITPEALEGLVKLAQCVRENGVPDFPDPDSEGRFNPRAIGLGPDDPRLEAAMATCRESVALEGGRIMIGG